ncbi:MAG: hypothetical protein F6K14_10635 [Symploca sp. SIO2C1]|nr:hypothetical protein [Symploca sp. SIO2C1]
MSVLICLICCVLCAWKFPYYYTMQEQCVLSGLFCSITITCALNLFFAVTAITVSILAMS